MAVGPWAAHGTKIAATTALTIGDVATTVTDGYARLNSMNLRTEFDRGLVRFARCNNLFEKYYVVADGRTFQRQRLRRHSLRPK